MGIIKKYWRVKIAGSGSTDFGPRETDAKEFAKVSKKTFFGQVDLESKEVRRPNQDNPVWTKEKIT